MGGFSLEFNEPGMRKLQREVETKIKQVDRRFRSAWEGKPAEDVRPRVAAAFSRIGVHVTEQNAQDYAAAVSAGEPFKWVLS